MEHEGGERLQSWNRESAGLGKQGANLMDLALGAETHDREPSHLGGKLIVWGRMKGEAAVVDTGTALGYRPYSCSVPR